MDRVCCDRPERRLRYCIPHRYNLAMPADLDGLEQMGQGAQGHLHEPQCTSHGRRGNVSF